MIELSSFDIFVKCIEMIIRATFLRSHDLDLSVKSCILLNVKISVMQDMKSHVEGGALVYTFILDITITITEFTYEDLN